MDYFVFIFSANVQIYAHITLLLLNDSALTGRMRIVNINNKKQNQLEGDSINAETNVRLWNRKYAAY